MNKKLREQVHNKYDGHCAYCGKPIAYSEMQVDHIIPRAKKHLIKSRKMKNCFGEVVSGINDFNNLMPTCRRCNHYKSSLSLKKFKKIWLGELHKRLKKIYIVKVALDYGIITIKPHDGQLHYEKIKEGKQL